MSFATSIVSSTTPVSTCMMITFKNMSGSPRILFSHASRYKSFTAAICRASARALMTEEQIAAFGESLSASISLRHCSASKALPAFPSASQTIAYVSTQLSEGYHF
uniref:Uncharacterized protein n=1 Tax=Arundo donax TaxID=35708 RepID=A0A0A9GVW9_ARUDO